MSQNVKVQETEKEQAEMHEKCFPNKVSFDNEDIKDTCSTPNQKKYMEKEVLNLEELRKCDICKYTCKKETSIKKHMLTKHEKHQCK